MADGARRCLNSEEVEQKTKQSPELELWHCVWKAIQEADAASLYENSLWSPTACLVNAEGIRTRFKLKVASRNRLKNHTPCASSFAVLEHDKNTVAGYKLDNHGHVIKGGKRNMEIPAQYDYRTGLQRTRKSTLAFPAEIVMMALSHLWPWGFFL